MDFYYILFDKSNKMSNFAAVKKVMRVKINTYPHFDHVIS